MKKILWRSLLWLLPFLSLHAQQEDSLHYKFPPIEVETERIGILETSSYIFSPEFLSLRSFLTLSSILNYAPGIYIRDYGGMGSLTLLSYRGHPSARTIIYLNDIPLNSFQNGVVDLSLLPVESLTSISISPYTHFQGEANIGGSVHLTVQAQNRPKVKAEYGSYNLFHTTIQSAFDSSSLLSIRYYQTDGNYPIHIQSGSNTLTFRRANSDIRKFSGIFLAGSGDDEKFQIQQLFYLHSEERGVPGPVLQGKLEDRFARLSINEMLHSIQWRFKTASLRSSTVLSLRHTSTHFVDPALTAFGVNGVNNHYRETQVMASLRAETRYGNFDLRGNSATLIGILHGPLLITKSTQTVSRIEQRLGISATFSLAPLKIGMTTQTILSQDVLALLPSLIVQSSHPIGTLTAAISKNFRFPTFNELYYFNYGNRNLKPESSVNIDFTFTTSLSSLLQLHLSIFYARVKNYILSVPKSPIEWQAANVGATQHSGIELFTAINLGRITSHFISFTYQRSTIRTGTYSMNDIPYVPRLLFRYIGQVHYKQMRIGASVEATSSRYALASNIPESKLPPYWIVDLFVEYISPLPFRDLMSSLRLECHNILNTTYSVILNYPMPGRIIRVTVQIK